MARDNILQKIIKAKKVKESVKERYDQLKEYYKDQLANDDISTTMLGNIISSEFFGS